MNRQPLSNEQTKNFIFAGNATITLEGKKTGKWYTYKIQKCKTNDNLYFVKRLSGSDNISDYRYIGCVYRDTEHFCAAKPYNTQLECFWPLSIEVIKWFFERPNTYDTNINVYHEGRCGRCGRKLTTPESIFSGFGPECRRYLCNM